LAALNIIIPNITFLAKFGIAMSFLISYQASYNDEKIFTKKMRASAIGQCQFIARGLTILAPEASELKKPIPMIICCISFIIALLVTSTFDFHNHEDISIQNTTNTMNKKRE
jgi:hypothetical protein